MILETGLKRQIREMFRTLGIQVTKLVRIRIGAFKDPELLPGRWRTLEAAEIDQLCGEPEQRRPRENRR